MNIFSNIINFMSRNKEKAHKVLKTIAKQCFKRLLQTYVLQHIAILLG